uniref:Uncharacterized protein n=2 Tax=Hemiselmis andersenii TaxID=464988 RepID=A0A6T8N202_HEMAN
MSPQEKEDMARMNAKRRLKERQMDLIRDYPHWAVNDGEVAAARGHGQGGEWEADRGPPYVSETTLYAGAGTDMEGSANLIRRVLGIPTSFRFHKWDGNNFLRSFDGPQFRFLYRNVHSHLVIPPLEKGGGVPLLGWNAIHRLYQYVNEGDNTLVVAGGPQSVLFINANVVNANGGYDLESKWHDGPYERQRAARGTPFEQCAVSLPGPGTQVHGVALASLPADAKSYYEAGDVSVVFEIPSGDGRIIFLGFDYAEANVPWVHALVAAREFGGTPKK